MSTTEMSDVEEHQEEERIAGSTLKERTVGRGWQLFQAIDQAYERGEIDDAEWHRRIGQIIGPAYLAAKNPRAQSGQSGTPAQWENARRLIFAAVEHDGTFLDVGCANGYLMECAARWLAEDGFHVEPYGLDIIPELVALARRRLPHWANRIYEGNALGWQPARQFDFVLTGLEYVPSRRRSDLIQHLLEAVVAPGGRLIIGAHSEPTGSEVQLEAAVAGWGFPISRRVEVPHCDDSRVVRRAFWIDRIEQPGTERDV